MHGAAVREVGWRARCSPGPGSGRGWQHPGSVSPNRLSVRDRSILAPPHVDTSYDYQALPVLLCSAADAPARRTFQHPG
eukprot:362536-Chlamydomonas_euryale.AAC.6